jgi:hypothetical protein
METYVRSTTNGPVKSTKALGTTSYARSNGLMSICLLALAAQSVRASGEKPPALMDQSAEIALALSACPIGVASKAAVYVLKKNGYVKVRDSQNGLQRLSSTPFPPARSRGAWMPRGHILSCNEC